MNQSTLTSRSVVQALIDAGVTNVIIAPGSRSAGLSLSLAAAARAALIQLHVRIDEREAGFLALGIAKASGNPVAVVVTSGTAVANLMPAVVEAYYSAIPLIVLTADRPESVRFSGAPQTINQAPMFTEYAKLVVDVPLTKLEDKLVDFHQVIETALEGRKGPVHLNVQFDFPLVPEVTEANWMPSKQLSAPIRDLISNGSSDILNVPARGLFIIGDVANVESTKRIGSLAVELGWPIIWEPSANAHTLSHSLSHGALICQQLPNPEVVVTLGTVGLSRSIIALLKATDNHIAIHDSSCGPNTPDPALTAQQIFAEIPHLRCTPDPEWLKLWKSADHVAEKIVDEEINELGLTGPAAAIQVWNHLSEEDALLVGASWSVRHIELFAGVRNGITVYGNRGANGIDGLISTGYGISIARSQLYGVSSRTFVLLGDIAFLYGMGGLLDSHEKRPNLTIVVLDNDGGGIFSQLEQGQPVFMTDFDTVFTTPQGRDIWVIAEALGVPATRATSLQELNQALNYANTVGGINVVVCSGSTRHQDLEIIQSITEQVRAATEHFG